MLLGGHKIGWALPDACDVLAALPGARCDATSFIFDPATDLEDAARRYWWPTVMGGGAARRSTCVTTRPARWSGGSTAARCRCSASVPRGRNLNGLVRRQDGLWVWIAKRTDTRPLDPGKLDHLVAGGVPAGFTPLETLVKEAKEEAGMSPELARQATPVGTITYAMDREEGLRRDRPALLRPGAAGGVRSETRRTARSRDSSCGRSKRALAAVRETDKFKFNVNLVLIDLFLRLGLVAEPEASKLGQGLRPLDPR